MNDRKDDGSLLKWFRRAFGLVSSVDKSGKYVPADTVFFDFEGFVDGWILGQREVSDFHTSRSTGPTSDSQILEHYAEHPSTGVRLSVFVASGHEMIGRAYFDRGDRTAKQVRVSLGGWENLIVRGRPRKRSALPMSDEDIFEKIGRREEWYVHGEAGPKPEYKVRIHDAAQQLAASMIPTDTADETEIDGVTEQILQAYHRVKKREGKK